MAIYCRVSTQDQSCERQERDLVELAARAGYEVAGVWKETASGTKDTRPLRREVLSLAQARKIDAVLVSELTRWGRSTVDLVRTLEDLRGWGVSLIAQHGLQFDLATPTGRLNASIMAALAQFETDMLRERVRSGMAAAKARGRRMGRPPGTGRDPGISAQVLAFRAEIPPRSIRWIAATLRISTTTVQAIARRALPTEKGSER